MSSDFDRAVEFAGCERRESPGWEDATHPYCEVHDSFDEPGAWPCPRTLDALRLIREVRADECEQAARDSERPHEGSRGAVTFWLRERAEKHREAT